MSGLGAPRVHLRRTGSTNERAKEIARGGAPHGTLVTAAEQTAGRGRDGRRWHAPAGRALLASLVLRDAPPLLPIAAALAVAEVAEGAARGTLSLKWPNDVLLDGRKLAGILVEARPAERWAVLGIGLNVAVAIAELPAELGDRAATLGLAPAAIEPLLAALLEALARRLGAPAPELIAAFRERDALLERRVRFAGGDGIGAGIDERGRLLVRATDGALLALDSGEVRLL